MAFQLPGIRSPQGVGKLSRFSTGNIKITVQTHMFFDRQAIKDATRYMNYEGLWRGSIIVRRLAQKSIKKKGMAKPIPKGISLGSGIPLAQLLARPGLASRTKGALIKRFREIQAPPASPPGTPPFTHVPSSHMLGFRRNLYNAFDRATQSAVVGPSQKGKRWILPARHEYGMPVHLRLYLWKPKTRGGQALVKWFDEEDAGEISDVWVPTKKRKRVDYPKRPFLQPALRKAIQTRQIAKAFRGTFGGRGGMGGLGAG
jgi:hypothetical protein